VWNFSEIYGALDGVHGAELVTDADRLTAHFAAWLTDPDACARVAETGCGVVEKLGGALERTLTSLDPYLMQLQLRQRARHA
jgi:3-deoxy-D-manno-octulosonic-acid transferase